MQFNFNRHSCIQTIHEIYANFFNGFFHCIQLIAASSHSKNEIIREIISGDGFVLDVGV